MLIQELKQLIDQLQHQYEHKTLDYKELESATSPLVVSDNFDSLPSDVQDEICFIDNAETEKPTIQQIEKSIEIFKKYINKRG